MRSAGGILVKFRSILLILAVISLVVLGSPRTHAYHSTDVSLVINGQIASSDVPPRIVPPGRTLVPVRVISESLGWQVDWLPATRQVFISRDMQGAFVILTVDDPVVITDDGEFTMDVPPVIIGDRTMVPIRFVAEALGGQVHWDNDTRTVSVAASLPEPDPEPEPEPEPGDDEDDADAPADVPGDVDPLISSLRWEDTADTYGLQVGVSGRYDVELFTDSEGGLVLTITGLMLDDELLGNHTFGEDRPVKRVRFRPSVDPYEVYMTVELRRDSVYNLRLQDDSICIDFARVDDIFVRPNGDVVFTTNIPITPRVFTLRNPARIVVDFPGTVAASDLSDEPLQQHDLLRYRLGNHDESEGDTFTGLRVVLDLSEELVPVVSDEAGGSKHKVVISPQRSTVAGRLIVIDPGHGGVDSGARGVSGSLEKDINIAISVNLLELLEAAGATVVMTRTGDYNTYIYDRPAIANDLNADVFISIHCNADPRGAAEGTETYYHPDACSASRSLAYAVQSQVVGVLGRPDRGVRTANFAVLREARVPAALLETLYMTSAADERMLLNPSIQMVVAEAIVAALEQYFATH